MLCTGLQDDTSIRLKVYGMLPLLYQAHPVLKTLPLAGTRSTGLICCLMEQYQYTHGMLTNDDNCARTENQELSSVITALQQQLADKPSDDSSAFEAERHSQVSLRGWVLGAPCCPHARLDDVDRCCDACRCLRPFDSA